MDTKATPLKYYIGCLYEVNGNYEYNHTILFITSANPRLELTKIAMGFYIELDKPPSSFANGIFSFFNGGITVSIESFKEIHRKLYLDMKMTGYF